jgi:competence protein ComEC
LNRVTVFFKILSLLIIPVVVCLVANINFTYGNSAQILRVHFLDVGYADAIFVEFPDQTNMIIDAGGESSGDKVTAYLKKRNIARIDTVLITHPHQNHFGGLGAVMREIPIGRFFHNGDRHGEEGYPELLEELNRRRIPIGILRRGREIDSLPDTVTMEVLRPVDVEDDSNPNANSVVTYLRYGETSILLTADIEEDQQAQLMRVYGATLKDVDCVKVPHHGGPLSDSFIYGFSDAAFIISTGSNAWGLPREEDLRRLQGKIYRTDQDGTIVVETDGENMTITP